MFNIDEYHGIIVREGIRDRTILNRMTILGTETGQNWTLLKVDIEAKAISRVIREIQSNLLMEKECLTMHTFTDVKS